MSFKYFTGSTQFYIYLWKAPAHAESYWQWFDLRMNKPQGVTS